MPLHIDVSDSVTAFLVYSCNLKFSALSSNGLCSWKSDTHTTNHVLVTTWWSHWCLSVTTTCCNNRPNRSEGRYQLRDRCARSAGECTCAGQIAHRNQQEMWWQQSQPSCEPRWAKWVWNLEWRQGNKLLMCERQVGQMREHQETRDSIEAGTLCESSACKQSNNLNILVVARKQSQHPFSCTMNYEF